jgi:hypothetical protein
MAGHHFKGAFVPDFHAPQNDPAVVHPAHAHKLAAQPSFPDQDLASQARRGHPEDSRNDPSFGTSDPPRLTYHPAGASRPRMDKRPAGEIQYTGPKPDLPITDPDDEPFIGVSAEDEFARRVLDYQRDASRGFGGVKRDSRR